MSNHCYNIKRRLSPPLTCKIQEAHKQNKKKMISLLVKVVIRNDFSISIPY